MKQTDRTKIRKIGAPPHSGERREPAGEGRDLSDFLARVAHELRTPLGNLREFVSIVEEGLAGPLGDRQKEYLGIALRNADTLAEMMEHLLSLAEIRGDSFRLDRKRVMIADLLQDRTLKPSHRTTGKSVTMRVHVPPNLPDAYADPDRILEAIRNLVDNSIKYSGDQVAITIEAASNRTGMIELRVRDNGFGMDETTRRNLFRREYRGSGAARANPKGLGLGLSIVREIVDHHGGKIAVQSRLHEGTEFRLLLPRFDPRAILDEALGKLTAEAARRQAGVAFVRASMARSQGLLGRLGWASGRQLRDALRRALGPEDVVLPEWRPGRDICFLQIVDRSAVRASVGRVLRATSRRLRLQTGSELIWEGWPLWIHSDDYDHPAEMAGPIHQLWCCVGERSDAA